MTALHTEAGPPARLPGAAVAALLAAGGAIAMTLAALALWPAALTGQGEDGLFAWLLLAVAAVGAALCVYLALIWGLAALALVAGPASRAGGVTLTALRLLAPQLARRVTVGAAVATTTTGLLLAPALASKDDLPGTTSTTSGSPSAYSMTAELGPHPDPLEDATAPPDAQESAPTERMQPPTTPGDRPGLGWPGADGGPAAPQDAAPHGAAPQDPAPPGPVPVPQDTAPEDAPGATAATVVVRPGDTLWSITDDLLGPGSDAPQDIATAWPRLYEANRSVIGADPDDIDPGQVLTVPDPFGPEEQS